MNVSSLLSLMLAPVIFGLSPWADAPADPHVSTWTPQPLPQQFEPAMPHRPATMVTTPSERASFNAFETIDMTPRKDAPDREVGIHELDLKPVLPQPEPGLI